MPNVKHPSENLSWPAWFYPPETDPEDPTAAGLVFKSPDDVPEGWAHHWSEHGQNLDREPPAPPPAGPTRTELRMELTKRDIAWSATDGKGALQKQLDEALELEKLENSV